MLIGCVPSSEEGKDREQPVMGDGVVGFFTKEGEKGRLVGLSWATIFFAVALTGAPCLGGERPKSWSQRATEARDQAMRCLAQFDLAGAAEAQSEYVDALAQLKGSDHAWTRWAEAFAHEWRELSQLPCDRQYAYLESLHLLFSPGNQAESDPTMQLADTVDALVTLEQLRTDQSFTALFGLVRMGDLACRIDDTHGAIAAYMEALNGLAATCGPDHPTMSGILERLAFAHTRLGEYRESERWHREALDIYRPRGSHDTMYLWGLLKLAANHIARGNLAEAEGLLVWARKLSEGRSVRSDALKGEIRFALAYVLARQGNFKEAADMLAFARRHFDQLTDSNEHKLEKVDQLGRFLDAHAAGASPSCEFPQPGMLWEEVDGELRLTTPAASGEEEGDPAEALARLKESRDKLQQHLECAELDKVVALQRERIALIESSPLKRHPLALHEEILLDEWKRVAAMAPDDQLHYARAHANLGLGERFLDGAEPDFAGAEECLLAAIAELEKLGLGESIHVAFACRRLSHIRRARRDYAAALGHAERAREIIASHYGPDDPHSFDAIDTIVRLHVELGELDAGARLVRESLGEARRAVRMNSPQYVGLLLSGATIHAQRGRLAEAEGMCRHATELASRLLEKSTLLEVECQCLLAQIHLAHGDLQQADTQFAQAWRLCQSPTVRDSPAAWHVIEGHARTLQALGRDAEAKERLAMLGTRASE